MTEIILLGEPQRQTGLMLLSRLDLSKPAPSPWVMELKRRKKKRTLSQNALYWKWVGILADDTGHDSDEVHDFFKRKFIAPYPVEIAGETILYRSTARLSTAEMHDFMERVYAFSVSQLGVLLPIPEEQFLIERAA